MNETDTEDEFEGDTNRVLLPVSVELLEVVLEREEEIFSDGVEELLLDAALLLLGGNDDVNESSSEEEELLVEDGLDDSEKVAVAEAEMSSLADRVLVFEEEREELSVRVTVADGLSEREPERETVIV